jgi:tetratricopeptide (TPR) repeat protein
MEKPMKRMLAILALFCACVYAQGVRVWEEQMKIPTYPAGTPDPNPLFYEGRTYQGAKGPIYPYPIIDKLTDVKVAKSYKAVYLENEYVRICVLPELGGRIFEGVDKTDNYDFFYRQHVIKPALIGMLGAWISGGVEWNIPHHHRASSFQPVEYKTEEHADGSKTIWVGEMELRHRMRWLMGMTLHPGKSYLEATMKLMNRTPLAHSFLYFANVAVHTNPDYQIIFPPSTEFVTQHAKREFSRWPIGSGIYAGQDFTGVDESWWKNHRRSISMFAHNSTEDFLAGYDHGKQAGTLHVADHGVVTGKKFFTWGVGSDWDQMLTDTDGPYLELMVGAYSDNQPDYSWAQPYEVKIATHYWYPFQRIGGVKNANVDAAVNLDVKGGRAAVGFAVTSAHPRATAVLEAKGHTLLNEAIAIDPGKPFYREIALPQGVKSTDLKARLMDGGEELVSYQPLERAQTAMPSPVEPPKPPKEIKTVEELYLTGLRLEQFYSPASEPDPYYEEALRRDPSDTKTNTALGILYLKRGRFADAEAHLRAAVNRLMRNYTDPKDGEALYYLGVALKAQGKLDEAYETLYRASWSYAWHTASMYALAQIAGQRGDFAKGIEFLDRSISTNTNNTEALLLKSAFLRRLKLFDQASAVATQASMLDPLDCWASREVRLAKSSNADQSGPGAPVVSNLDYEIQEYLEMAADYSNAGLYEDGASALAALVSAYQDSSRVYPMAYYWLGYLSERQGKADKAAEYYRLASRMPAAYCFPFRMESIAVLEQAMAKNPSDARAPYYLGDLLYDSQPEVAVREWEKARGLDNDFALVHRNLGWAYSRTENGLTKAIASMERAVALDPQARFLFELDRLYEAANTKPEIRLALLEKNHNRVLDRDDTLEREIRLLVLLGKYDRALKLLSIRRFHSWEGGARFSVHTSYIDAQLGRGNEYLAQGDAQRALQHFKAALKFPENLSAVENYQGEKSAQVYYSIGVAQEKLGQREQAQASFESAAKQASPVRRRRGSTMSIDLAETLYYQALALQKIGRQQEAAAAFARLVEMGKEGLSGAAAVDFFAKFGERQTQNARTAQAHYAVGLGLLGEGKRAEARAELEEVLKLNVNHLGAKLQLAPLR